MKQLITTFTITSPLATTAFAGPIHDAAEEGDLAGVQAKLDKGADVNAKEEEGYTPLDFAIIYENTEIANLLLEHDGKSGAADSIQVAATVGNIEAVKRHLAAGVDVNAKSEVNGQTSLHTAANNGRKEIAEQLIDNGADVNAMEVWGATPLNLATGGGRKEIVELLITKGADVNANGGMFGTPLDRAIRNEQTKTADLLRELGGKTGEELKAEGN
jgi:ankyrin repeat protein